MQQSTLKKRAICAVLSFFAITALSFAEVTVIENTPEVFRFSWDLSEIDTTSILLNGKRVTSLSFDESNVTLGATGEAAVPGYGFYIGVPQSGTVTAQFTPQTTKTLQLKHSPNNVIETETLECKTWITVHRYRKFRSLRTAQILFSPVRYNAAENTITVIRKGTGTIRFPASSYRPGIISTGDYEKMLETMVLNYHVASGWKSVSGLQKTKASALPFSFNNPLYSFKIGDGHKGFNEATINSNGLIKISAEKITELFGNTPVSKLKLFAAHKGMLPHELPSDGTIPDGVIEIPLYRVDNNDDGTFNDDDYVLAYVSESTDWKVDCQRSTCRYTVVIDSYDEDRTYWLTASGGTGASLEKYESTYDTPDTVLTHITVLRRFEQPNVRRSGDQGSQRWFTKILSEKLKSSGYHIDLPGLDPSIPGSLVYYGYAKYGGTIDIRFGDEKIGTLATPNKAYVITEWADSIRFSFNEVADKDDDRVELDFFDIEYSSALHVRDGSGVQTILPPLMDTNKVIAAYDVSIDKGASAYVLRVSEDDAEMGLIAKLDGDEKSSFRWIDSTVYGVRYVIVNEEAITTLDDVTPYEPATVTGKYLEHDLRAVDRATDFLIVTHGDFIPAADSLAAHKKHIGFEHPVVVDVADIYRLFSGGDKDATALRNFIGYVQRYWKGSEALDYVLFMGVGHYDAKNLLANARDYIPVFIDDDENYENYFTRTAPAESEEYNEAQLAIGRLPCSTLDQAWAMVRKIVQYESPNSADFSEWRNRMLFVADDDMQGEKVDQVALSTPHHLSSDRTATIVDTLWPSIDIRKVYLYEYEWDQAKQKPGASRALINEINNGVGYINFYGHGADVTWTDEYILTQDMVAGMSNGGRYPVVSAFSCSVGKFDIPGAECLSGVLAKADGAGSIASISSTREAYATANENLAKSFYRFLFDTTATRSIGMALVQAQMNVSGSGQRTYVILGDPSVCAIRPTNGIKLTIDDDDDTLAALQKITVSGKLVTASGKHDKNFGSGNDYVALGLFNAPDTAIRKDGGEREVKYVLPGTPVFLGKTRVVNGSFSQTILVPQNLTFNREGIKMTAYAWSDNGKSIGIGYRNDLIFSGSVATSTIKDSSGPQITIRPVYDNKRFSGVNASFTNHITVQTPVTCEVELFDVSGIDAAGIGPEEGVTLEIEGVVSRQNVNSKMQFKNGDFRRGIVSVVYEEEVVQPGSYEMVVTARDLIGNLSKAKFTLEVTEYDELTLDHVLNFPNPVRLGKPTRFYCHTNYTSHEYYSADVRLTIKIYTLSGRLLRVIRNARNGEEWDCRDQRGNLLSPDVYLYQVIAEDIIQRKTEKSKIMKLVILPPR